MGLVLNGILRAPYPDNPSEMGVVEWEQARSAMEKAADDLEGLSLLAAELWGMLTPEQKRGKEDRYHKAQDF